LRNIDDPSLLRAGRREHISGTGGGSSESELVSARLKTRRMSSSPVSAERAMAIWGKIYPEGIPQR